MEEIARQSRCLCPGPFGSGQYSGNALVPTEPGSSSEYLICRVEDRSREIIAAAGELPPSQFSNESQFGAQSFAFWQDRVDTALLDMPESSNLLRQFGQCRGVG